jgi:hypothetical protein
MLDLQEVRRVRSELGTKDGGSKGNDTSFSDSPETNSERHLRIRPTGPEGPSGRDRLKLLLVR